MQAGAAPEVPDPTSLPRVAGGAESEPRIAQLVKGEFAFVWRTLRRFGVSPSDADDAAQQVFLIVADKIDDVKVGSERSFLFGTAMRIASRCRRTQTRRREVGDGSLEAQVDPGMDMDQLLEQRRARQLLDDVLDTLAEELRAVFVLYEIEQLTMAEIAELFELPMGTVASRLRRAREAFQVATTRIRSASSGMRMAANALDGTPRVATVSLPGGGR